MSDKTEKLRVDKWLWHARFFKTRGLSAKLVTGGHLRINSDKVHKASASVSPGDVLTFPQGNRIRVVKVLGLGTRRGPAPEAQALYEDMSPEPDPPKHRVGARPTKKERRDMDKLPRGDWAQE